MDKSPVPEEEQSLKSGKAPIPNRSGILSQLMIYFEDKASIGKSEPKTEEITRKTLRAHTGVYSLQNAIGAS